MTIIIDYTEEMEIKMETKKDFSWLNCIATAMLAYFFTVPVHELFHAITDILYGDKIEWYSAGAVQSYPLCDRTDLSYFDRIMLGGGSATFLNIIVGIILLIIVLKVTMGPTMRVFLIQLMGAHLSCGIGYFMIGGFFAAGDWGNVFAYFPDDEGFITVMRIILSIVGSIGIVALFFLLNYLSYYFIEDATDKKTKLRVGLKLHLVVLIVGYAVGLTITALSPMGEELNMLLGLLYNMMWIPFFWGFMFTGVMNVLPPKVSRFKYNLPVKPNYILWIVAVVLILVDICVFGPGLHFEM